jgi:NAD(P)-dependent dehydrogenase (short-subunit alcohol dehydrogenase family)
VTLKDETTLVTGAAHGIGLATARLIAQSGGRVIAVDIDGDLLRESCGTFASELIAHDISLDASALVDRINASASVVRGVVHNVGIMNGKPFLELTEDEMEKSWRANFLGPAEVSRLLAKRLVEKGGGGSFVFTSSLHNHRVRMCPDYSTSKAAMTMLVQEMAAELGGYGIRVNQVSPGAIDTWSDRALESVEHRLQSEACIPLGRIGAPEEVATVISFLLDSKSSGYVTGSDIKIDGGLDTYNWLHHLYKHADGEMHSAPSHGGDR